MATARRTDSASRCVNASPQTVYQAFADPDAWVTWLPPAGTPVRPREGGSYRMALAYSPPDPSVRGKTSADTDVVEGRFLEVAQNERIVHLVTFVSDDPAFAGEMKMTWSVSSVPGGTNVSIICENAPEGIGQEDHETALRSTLDNLATLVER